MKLFKNKLFIGLLCITAGIAIVFYGIPKVASEQSKKVEVLEATENIEAGTMLTDEMMRYVEIPSSMSPDNAATFESSVGKYAISTIYSGDIVTTAKIVNEYMHEDTYALATGKGKVVVSISAKNISAIAAARIRPGDVVTVMALPNSRNYGNSNVPDSTGIEISTEVEPTDVETEEPNITEDTESMETASTGSTPMPTKIEPSVLIYPELQYIEIAAIVAKEGENASVNTEPVEDEENSLPVTISFYATEEQAMRLAELEKNGTAYIAFVARGDEALTFIPESEKVLK